MTSTAATDLDLTTAAPSFVIGDGIPGFPTAHHFRLVHLGAEESPFSVLRCVDADGGPEFVVVPPATFFPTYRCNLEDGTVERLGISRVTDVVVLVIVTLGERPEDATANLLAPVVINTRTGRAAQVALTGSDYGLRVPLRRG